MHWPFPSAFATWDQSPCGHALFLLFPLALPPVWVCVWCSLPPQALPILFSQTDLLSGTSWKLQIPFSRSKHGEAGLACQKTELTNWCAKISVDRPTWIPGYFPIQTECCFTDQNAKKDPQCMSKSSSWLLKYSKMNSDDTFQLQKCVLLNIKHNKMDGYGVESDVKQYFPHFNMQSVLTGF